MPDGHARAGNADQFTAFSAARIHANWTEAALYEEALRRGEGQVASRGALVVRTGAHTGRSAQDKFIVHDEETENTVWWEKNAALAPAQFDLLWEDMKAYMAGRDIFTHDLYAGADPAHRANARVATELAWHGLFIRHLLRRPERDDLIDFEPEFTIVNLPGFRADPVRHGVRSETVIALDFTRKLVLIAGTQYAGETKKAVFSLLNYVLPARGVMPMHCSVNVGKSGDAAVFFGLSGTGKTTLSADPERVLVGDDEHGWSSDGLFNFEGGCYAKMIRLCPKAEPQIHDASQRWGAVLENVVIDPVTREPDFCDASLAENSRGAYPLDHVPGASRSGTAGHPNAVVMLTCDAFGVLPPVSRLTPRQAVYHFLSGYTAKVAGTERGVTEPKATFSTCFGAPFMARRPVEYGRLLERYLESSNAECWLVNTGWTGGAHGTGERMPIAATRAIVSAALSGALADARFRMDPVFGLLTPEAVEGVDPALLNPRGTWRDPAAYDAQAARLAHMFEENMAGLEVGDSFGDLRAREGETA